MDDTLLKYDESLEELEKQRENLELVMKKMGAEWEESGAGIGWMGDILYSNHHHTSANHNTTPTTNNTHNDTPLPPPLLSLMHSVTSSTSEPSHDYLQTLLNVNDELLARSLASSNAAASANSSNNKNTHDYHPQLLKAATFVSHHMPISPCISQDSGSEGGENTPPTTTAAATDDTAAAAVIQQRQKVVNSIVQFTPPITPE